MRQTGLGPALIALALTAFLAACGAAPKLASVLRSPLPVASPSSSPSPSSGAPVSAAPAKQLRAAWPGAFFSVRLPDDKSAYALDDALDATHLVVTAWPAKRADKASIDVLDTETGKLRKVATMPEAGMLTRVWVSDRYAVLVTLPSGAESQRIWAVSLDDGHVTEVKGVGDAMGSPAAILGDTLYYASAVRGGVFRVGLPGGGTPEPVEGSQGLFLVSWPWAADQSPANVSPSDVSSDVMTKYLAEVLGNPLSDLSIDAKVNQTRLINLETGEVRPVVPAPGVTHLRCGPEWCRGRDAAGRDVVQRPNGTALALLPGRPVGGDGPIDRFFIVLRPASTAQEWDTLVYDARTGTTGLGPTSQVIDAGGAPTSGLARAPYLISCSDGCDAPLSGVNLRAVR
ncbi:hypothetical protein J5X84_04530 [Streptosporangiaceae bacterium NEAU-GS5]|nr:hypothetical protein [Streptosporangiaceae bacterium NEAU-GS5]